MKSELVLVKTSCRKVPLYARKFDDSRQLNLNLERYRSAVKTVIMLCIYQFFSKVKMFGTLIST